MFGPFSDTGEILETLGERVRALRIRRELDQASLADKAGISLKAVRNLERGAGSTLETLVRVLKALEETSFLEAIVPTPLVNPLDLLTSPKPRMRVRRRRS